MSNTKLFVLLVGEHTRYLQKFVRWEIEQALLRDLPVIAVNLNGRRSIDKDKCPALLRDQLAIHVSFNAAIMQRALDEWPESHARHRRSQHSGPYYYKDAVYVGLGL